jgi:hypothetical protein
MSCEVSEEIGIGCWCVRDPINTSSSLLWLMLEQSIELLVLFAALLGGKRRALRVTRLDSLKRRLLVLLNVLVVCLVTSDGDLF